MDDALIGLDEIKAAAEVISGRIHRTPLMGSTYLSDLLGVELYFKMELFQKTGSFKPRGVLNKLAAMSEEDGRRGLITLSAGNHAQALAWGAAQAGYPATVVMPAGAPRSKVDATRGYGGKVIQTDGDLLRACLDLQAEQSLTLVHPFDDSLIIAGQGTVGLEIMEDLPGADLVITGVGGGGLISGVAAAVKGINPAAQVIGVEPAGASAMSQSLVKGEPIHLDSVNTAADGLAAPFAGQITFAHVKALVDRVTVLEDGPILQAMATIWERLKATAEPAASAPLAGLLSGAIKPRTGSKVVCLISGGNIDRARIKDLL